MKAIDFSASSVRPCMTCHRGLSGRCRRTKMMTMPRIGPIAKPMRQAMLGSSWLSRTKVPMFASRAPNQ
jgi:hypothetical protein